MNGTFNGVPIENVIALKIYETRTSLRVLGCPRRQLVRHFKRGSPADVKFSIHEFKGKVVRYRHAGPAGVYEITIESTE